MNIIPLFKCEYAVWKAPGGSGAQVEFRYDVTLAWEDSTGAVKLCLLDKGLRDGIPQWIPGNGIPLTTIATRPTGCVMQYGAYLIVSIFDDKTYIAWPTHFDMPVAPANIGSIPGWNYEVLGLDVCPTPQTYDFPETLEGDLIVLAGERVNGENDIVLRYQTLTTTAGAAQNSADEYANNVQVRLPINAQYWRSGFLPPNVGGGTPPDGPPVTGALAQIAKGPNGAGLSTDGGASIAIVETGLIPRWKTSLEDKFRPVNSIDRYQHRGYFYRFCFLRQFTNADGNVVTQRSNPSVDLFVPAVNYSPFFWSAFGRTDMGVTANTPGFPQQILAELYNDTWQSSIANMHWGDGNGSAIGVSGIFGHAFLKDQVPPPTPVPNPGAWMDLQTKFRAYFDATGPNDPVGAGQNGDAMQWASQWLGWSTQGLGGPNALGDWGTMYNTDYQHLPPWICDVSTEQLLSSPQTIFNFADFGVTNNAAAGTCTMPGPNGPVILAGQITSIEVYRTAYEDQDPIARPVSTPLFQPHTYGLVGSIPPGGSFTDTTKIPDFGQDPGAFEGYLRGQFSGDVIFQYGQSPAVVLGNVRDDYSLEAPSPLMQAFARDGNGGSYDRSIDFVLAADGMLATQFYFCYEDNNGYRSPATPIHNPDLSGGGGNPCSVYFTFPFGYDPNIVNIILFEGKYAAGARTYKQIAVVQPEPGTYLSNGSEWDSIAGTVSLPSGNAYNFYEPGAIIYSAPDEPWFWPQAQAEKHSSEFPVRGLFDMMGELGVATDSSYTLTLLRAAAPRSERETQEVGLITKHAIAKVEDAVVILSQHGVQFLVPSRAEDLPSNVKVELLSYLTELIPSYMPLYDLRRASIGYLPRRKEIWLHVPSSVDLWPKLPDVTGALTLRNPKAQPQRTFIFRFLESIRNVQNYTFDISPDFELKNLSQTLVPGAPTVIAGPDMVDIATFNPTQVLFSTGSDGGMYASYCDPTTGYLITLDCDDPAVDYDGSAYLAVALGMTEPTGQKQIARTEVLMTARGDVEIITGIPKSALASGVALNTAGGTSLLAGWDAIRGFIHNAARKFKFRKIYTDQPRKYNHPASELGVETTGSTVMVRLRTSPLTTPDGVKHHKVTIDGLTVYYDPKHQHG